MIEISTDRLVIRKTNKSDKDKELLVSLIGDWEVAKWLSSVPHPYTEDDAEAWFKTLHQKEFSLGIYLDNSLIGGVGLVQDEDKFYEFHNFVIARRGFAGVEGNAWANNKEQLADITYEWKRVTKKSGNDRN